MRVKCIPKTVLEATVVGRQQQVEMFDSIRKGGHNIPGTAAVRCNNGVWNLPICRTTCDIDGYDGDDDVNVDVNDDDGDNNYKHYDDDKDEEEEERSSRRTTTMVKKRKREYRNNGIKVTEPYKN